MRWFAIASHDEEERTVHGLDNGHSTRLLIYPITSSRSSSRDPSRGQLILGRYKPRRLEKEGKQEKHPHDNTHIQTIS